ncbi:unnamed protein product [Cuscuta epithymum]|uniref:Uncharacterized protein n=1 Tax=Cuscuta epithymum TaxID=186058 RepID=A0AAV0F6A5_9ASTE|nr:unnamed protein product [Cuscuta epithymum]
MHGNNPYPYLSGTADSSANTPSRRNRDPTGFIPVAPSAAVPGVPAMLDITAVNPMYTLPRGPANLFVPDAQMLFHVLGICDGMMNSTDHFTRSFPGWLPIVSHLYISVLWNFMILKVFVNSGHGAMFDLPHFQIGECMIPGPLVPFFQSLAAVSGPFDWIGDIVPHLPGFSIFWNAVGFHANSDYARQVPVPALILDQLYHFATWQIPEDTTIFDKFEWYGNIFSQDIDTHNSFNCMGPQLCGSLWTSSEQLEAARWFWNAAFCDIRFSRVDATRDPFSHYHQLFGFVSQTGTPHGSRM